MDGRVPCVLQSFSASPSVHGLHLELPELGRGEKTENLYAKGDRTCLSVTQSGQTWRSDLLAWTCFALVKFRTEAESYSTSCLSNAA